MDLKQLKALIALCRKSGILTVKMGDTEIHFSDNSSIKTRKPYTKKKYATDNLTDIIENESELSPEQLLFYSATDSQEQPS